MMKKSNEQLQALEAARSGESFALVAGAGCGKSTILRWVAEESPEKHFLYIVFNRKNREEAMAKMPANTRVTTANALAYRAIIRPEKRDLVKEDLSHHYILNLVDKQVYQDFNYKTAVLVGVVAKNLLGNYLKSTDEKPGRSHLDDTWKKSKAKYVERGIEVARKYWEKARNLECDITHDVYMKIWMLSNPQIDADVILYDEVQDASQIMIASIGAQKCQKIIVGDPYQQLYAFLGAQNALIKMGLKKQLKLTQSFRYGPKIAALANRVVESMYGTNPELKGWEGHDTRVHMGWRDEGAVTYIARTNGELIRKAMDSEDDNYSILINPAEVKSIARSIYAINNGLPVTHPSLVGVESMKELRTIIEEGQATGLAGWVSSYMKHGYGAMMDVAERCVTRYTGQTPHLYISAHKSKGLEFPNVQLAGDFPQPFKDEEKKKPNEKHNEDEINIQYVALTRAIENLYLGRSQFLGEQAGLLVPDNAQQQLFA